MRVLKHAAQFQKRIRIVWSNRWQFFGAPYQSFKLHFTAGSTGHQLTLDTWKRKARPGPAPFTSVGIIPFYQYNLWVPFVPATTSMVWGGFVRRQPMDPAVALPGPTQGSCHCRAPTNSLHPWLPSKRHHTTPPTSPVTLPFNNCICIDLNCSGKALRDNSRCPDPLRC